MFDEENEFEVKADTSKLFEEEDDYLINQFEEEYKYLHDNFDGFIMD